MRLLLDTNIVLAYLRETTWVTNFVDTHYDIFHAKTETLISVVSLGELESLAIRNRWGTARYTEMGQLLRKFVTVDINYRPVIRRYGEIDSFSQGKLPNQPLRTSARNMGKNDLWIAATASVLEAKLLTTDADFGHLKDVFVDIDQIPVRPSS